MLRVSEHLVFSALVAVSCSCERGEVCSLGDITDARSCKFVFVHSNMSSSESPAARSLPGSSLMSSQARIARAALDRCVWICKPSVATLRAEVRRLGPFGRPQTLLQKRPTSNAVLGGKCGPQGSSPVIWWCSHRNRLCSDAQPRRPIATPRLQWCSQYEHNAAFQAIPSCA